MIFAHDADIALVNFKSFITFIFQNHFFPCLLLLIFKNHFIIKTLC